MDFFQDTCGRRRCLQLIWLFVLEAAATCPEPQRGKNFVLTIEAILMNEFPNGTVVNLECANGYERESGSAFITCADGKWTEPDIVCKKKDCGPPTPLDNASFDIKGDTLFGAMIKVVCDKGYEISGMSYKQCYSSGWSGNAKCEIVTCERPKDVLNSKSQWSFEDEPKYGDSMQFVCDEGYTLIGHGNITCSETGEFSPPPPVCSNMTTEEYDKSTTNTVATTPLPASAVSTDSSATTTAHRDRTVTTSATPTVSPSDRGGKDIFTVKWKTTAASLTPFQDKLDEAVNTNTDNGYIYIIIAVICIIIVSCIVVLFLHKFLLRRKGSYDTKEDLKPELLQFQNL